MENVTENRGRGRPRKWKIEGGGLADYWNGPADDLELQDRPMLYSRRQKQNIVLAFRARDRITQAAEHDHDATDIPRTVLTELGRIEDDEAFWQAVSWYEEEGSRMRAKDAAAAIRRMRTGKPARDATDKLIDALWDTLWDHLKSRPDTEFPDAVCALEIVKREARRLPWA